MDQYAPPSQLERGQLQTRNNCGFDMGMPCHKVESWIEAYDGKLPLFDLGSGYGTNVRAALQRRPDMKVVAVDCCDDHLAYIRAASPEAVADGRLRTVSGKLPDDVSIEEGGASGILIAQVIHFLSPSEVTRTFDNTMRWLAPGGTLLLLCMSHYFQPNIDSGHLDPVLRQIEEEGADNPDSWPGWIPDTSSHMAIWQLPAAAPSLQSFTDAQIRAVAERAGLEVMECSLVSGACSNYPDILMVRDTQSPYYGKEQVVLVARKPVS